MKKSKSEKRKRSGLKSVLPLMLFTPLLLATLASTSVAQSPTEIKDVRFSPEKLSASFADVATRVESAVVSIDAKTFTAVTARGEFGLSPDDIAGMPNRQARPSYSVGSGFLVDSIGHIITNFHVVDDAASISVRLLNGKEYTARLVGSDQETDLAVLKIETSEQLPL